MIEIRSYNQEDNALRVKLRCSCGRRALQKRMKGEELVIECQNCNARITLLELQGNATSIWQTMEWILDGVPDADSSGAL